MLKFLLKFFSTKSLVEETSSRSGVNVHTMKMDQHYTIIRGCSILKNGEGPCIILEVID